MIKSASRYIKEIANKKSELEASHLSGAGGFEISRLWREFVDSIIIKISNETGNFNETKEFALIAIGGYGRGELNPQSDIDLLFLFEKEVPLSKKGGPTEIIPHLWDIGFKVGHSTRTITDCIKISQHDLISKTSMIESRFLLGNRELFDFFERQFRKKAMSSFLLSFVKSKSLETELRHESFHNTLFLTEPNIKESPGGLRDYQTALWVAIARYEVKGITELETRGLITIKEKNEVLKAVDFLFKIRNDIHFQADKPTDVLAYGLQPSVAKRLGYKGKDEHTVPAMMNDYYRSADIIFKFQKSVTDQAKRYKGTAVRVFQKLRHKQLAPNIFAGFQEIYTKELSAKNIADNPDVLFKIFTFIGERELKPSSTLLKTLLDVGELWKDEKPSHTVLGQGFRELLKLENPFYLFRLMRDAKILTAIVPEFYAIRFLTPFDLYHRYTVDEHTFFAIREFDNLKRNELPECATLRTLYEAEDRKDLVRLAILLHDVGKGGDSGEHEDDVDEKVITRLGYSMDEAKMIRRIVQLHLLMNMVAQRRDISDPKTVESFCKEVGNKKILKKLYLLTFADTKSVGPDVWNSWKGKLLNDLFKSAMAHFNNEPIKKSIPEKLSPKTSEFVYSMPERYINLRKNSWIEKDAKLFEKFKNGGIDKPVIGYNHLAQSRQGYLVLIAKNRIGLLSTLVGALISKNVYLHHATILTRKDGIAFDILRITGSKGEAITDIDLWGRIEKEVLKALNGEVSVSDMVASRKNIGVTAEHQVRVKTNIKVINDQSFGNTILEIIARDKEGLLYDITRTLASLKIDIVTAHLSTEGERAIDTFYVTEQNSSRIRDSQRITEIKKELLRRLP